MPLTALGTQAFHFCYPIDAESVDACIDDLDEGAAAGSQLEVILNTPGGGVLAGLALYDYIRWLRLRGLPVTTSCLGMAASIAPAVLQAGERRVIAANAYLLIHPIGVMADDEDSEIKDEQTLIEMLGHRVIHILAERSTMNASELTDRMQESWWLDAAEALALGFVDEIR